MRWHNTNTPVSAVWAQLEKGEEDFYCFSCRKHLRHQWPSGCVCQICVPGGSLAYVYKRACVQESSLFKSCWVSMHSCLRLQDRRVWRCVFTHTHRSGSAAGGCARSAVTTNSCAGLNCLQPFVFHSLSEIIPVFQSERGWSLTPSVRTVQQKDLAVSGSTGTPAGNLQIEQSTPPNTAAHFK